MSDTGTEGLFSILKKKMPLRHENPKVHKRVNSLKSALDTVKELPKSSDDSEYTGTEDINFNSETVCDRESKMLASENSLSRLNSSSSEESTFCDPVKKSKHSVDFVHGKGAEFYERSVSYSAIEQVINYDSRYSAITSQPCLTNGVSVNKLHDGDSDELKKCDSVEKFDTNDNSRTIPSHTNGVSLDAKLLSLDLNKSDDDVEKSYLKNCEQTLEKCSGRTHSLPQILETSNEKQGLVKSLRGNSPRGKNKSKGCQSWLLRLFESKMFDMSIAVSYLFNSKEPGVQSYLGKIYWDFVN